MKCKEQYCKETMMKNRKTGQSSIPHIQKLFQSVLLFLVLLASLETETSAQSGAITNVHDPCIIKCNNYYYIYSTGRTINIRRSDDLLDWNYVGSVFDKIPSWGEQEIPGVSNIWAPDVFYYDSTYYLYYALSTFGSNLSCIGLATNVTLNPDDSSYKWIDRGKVIQSKTSDDFNAIDPDVLMDINGRFWISFGSFWSGIKLVELDSNNFKPKQDYTLYSIASHGGGAIEAPYIVYKNGFYYLFVSFDYCCRGVNSSYNIRVGRSPEINGPYKDKNGISMMAGGGSLLLSGDSRWKGPGSCAVLLQEDSDWLIYHAYDAENNGIATLRISHLNWDTNGWPSVGTSVHVESLFKLPDKFLLYQNYPNPFNPTTEIKYSIIKNEFVILKVYDIFGRKMKTLVNKEESAGVYVVSFDASNLASGIYFFQIQTDDFTSARKMLLIK